VEGKIDSNLSRRNALFVFFLVGIVSQLRKKLKGLASSRENGESIGDMRSSIIWDLKPVRPSGI
jgi:hypothetical protein